MTSILTNVAAMSALSTLRGISAGMEETQARVSSGLRVGSAADNAAYWSIATTMRSDNMALSAVQDALGLGAAKVDTAYAGMESAIEVVKEIKAKLVAATEDGVDKDKVQGEITQLTEQLKGIVDAASFSGENWLKGTDGDAKTVVGSFVREGNSVSVKMIDYAMKSLITTGATDGTGTGIFDKEYTSLGADSVTLDLTEGGVAKSVTVEAFSTDFLIEQDAKFDGNIAITDGQAYVKVQGSWVKGTIVENADLTTNTKELAGVFTKDFDAVADGMAATTGDAIVVTEVAPGTVDAGQSILGIDITGMSSSDVERLMKGVDAALTDLTSAAAELGSISMRIGLQEDFASKLADSIDSGVGRLVDADMNEESTRLKALQTQQQLAIQSLSIANSASESILTLFR